MLRFLTIINEGSVSAARNTSASRPELESDILSTMCVFICNRQISQIKADLNGLFSCVCECVSVAELQPLSLSQRWRVWGGGDVSGSGMRSSDISHKLSENSSCVDSGQIRRKATQVTGRGFLCRRKLVFQTFKHTLNPLTWCYLVHWAVGGVSTPQPLLFFFTSFFSSAVNLEASLPSHHGLQARGCRVVLWDGRGAGQVCNTCVFFSYITL